MKFGNYAVIAVAASLFASASHAVESNQGIAGYLNPQTGVFTTRPALVPAAAPVTAGATITVNFAVKIDSSVPLSQPITCSVYISSSDSSFFNTASAQNFVVKSSASVGTCTVSIPYIWQIAATTTTMSVNPSVSTQFSSNLYHSSSASVAPFPVPTTGTKTIVVTLAL